MYRSERCFELIYWGGDSQKRVEDFLRKKFSGDKEFCVACLGLSFALSWQFEKKILYHHSLAACMCAQIRILKSRFPTQFIIRNDLRADFRDFLLLLPRGLRTCPRVNLSKVCKAGLIVQIGPELTFRACWQWWGQQIALWKLSLAPGKGAKTNCPLLASQHIIKEMACYVVRYLRELLQGCAGEQAAVSLWVIFCEKAL